jgi:hypothetical protein
VSKFDRIKPTKRHLFTNTRVRACKVRLTELQDDSQPTGIVKSVQNITNLMIGGIIEPISPTSNLHTHLNRSLSLWFFTKNNLEAIDVLLNEKNKIATLVQSRHKFNIGLTYFSPTPNTILLFLVPIAARSTHMISTCSNGEFVCFKIPEVTEIDVRHSNDFINWSIRRISYLKQS